MHSSKQAIDRPIVLGVAGSVAAVAASASPRMMAAALAHLGIEAYYVPLAVRASATAKALRSIPRLGFRGCNVTMPCKQVAAEVAHTRSEAVERTGAANVLTVGEDGAMHADATDGTGLVRALQERGVSLQGARVVLVGAGGVALEAAIACIDEGVERIDVWNRTRSRADALADRLHLVAPALDVQVHDRMPIREPAHVLLGCVPADTIDPRVFTALHADTLVADFAYRRDGRPTPMMAAVHDRPEQGIDGHELLVRQGAESLRIWFGIEAPIEVMMRASR